MPKRHIQRSGKLLPLEDSENIVFAECCVMAGKRDHASAHSGMGYAIPPPNCSIGMVAPSPAFAAQRGSAMSAAGGATLARRSLERSRLAMRRDPDRHPE